MSMQQRSFLDDSPPSITTAIAPAPGSPSKITLSEPVKVDLAVYRGDSGSFRITVKDVDDAPIDVSGATWDADIRTTAPATTVLANFDIVPVVEDTSSIDVILTAESSALLTGACVYDVEMTLNGGVTTLIYGGITVTQDVSRT